MNRSILILLFPLSLCGMAAPKPPTLWKTQCATCHGLTGKVTEAGKVVGARNLTDYSYMKTRSDTQLKTAILEGAKNDKGVYTMIPYKQILKKGELEALMRYVRELSKK